MAMYQFEYFDAEAWAAMHPAIRDEVAPEQYSTSPLKITGSSLLYWTEHCVECGYPDCYTTCDLYKPRRDMSCRRFPYGIQQVEEGLPGTVGDSAARICFGKWAHLWCIGSPVCFSPASQKIVKKLHNWSLAAADAANSAVTNKSGRLLQRFFGIRYRAIDALRKWPGFRSKLPDAFLIRVVNPQTQKLPLSLTIRNFPVSNQPVEFQWKQVLQPGFSEFIIPVQEIEQLIDFSKQIRLSINILPEENKELIFLAADFITIGQTPVSAGQTAGPQVKCLVFDLDNTLWNGVLLEMDDKTPVLRQGVLDLIQSLDARGILLSVASKNNHDDAINAIKAVGLHDYLLHPQVSWEPKSESIQKIAKTLNIGLDAIAFIDDQPFERAEVQAALPEVMTFDVENLGELLNHPGFAGAGTAEAQGRRHLYKAEERRRLESEVYRGDFKQFLKSCNLVLTISKPSADVMDRLHELIQRTNQLNFSGRRYSRAELESFLEDPKSESYVLRVADKFGDYGIVGYARVSVQPKENDMFLEDLALSCRVQSKLVEHTFLAWLAKQAELQERKNLTVRYNYTERNAPAGKVFDDLGFQVVRMEETIRWLKLELPFIGFESPVTVIDEASLQSPEVIGYSE